MPENTTNKSKEDAAIAWVMELEPQQDGGPRTRDTPEPQLTLNHRRG
jgi:hypothetical protein